MDSTAPAPSAQALRDFPEHPEHLVEVESGKFGTDAEAVAYLTEFRTDPGLISYYHCGPWPGWPGEPLPASAPAPRIFNPEAEMARIRRITAMFPWHWLDTATEPRRHKSSITTELKAAKRAGAASATLPSGTRVTFGEREQSAPTELDDWIAKHAR
jgi:hypothetical protein